jgi:hypothetical protein
MNRFGLARISGWRSGYCPHCRTTADFWEVAAVTDKGPDSNGDSESPGSPLGNLEIERFLECQTCGLQFEPWRLTDDEPRELEPPS